MHTEVMKWVSLTALLLAMVFWRSAPNRQGELNLVVSAAVAAVLIQAYQAKERRWATGFPGLAPHPLLSIPSSTERTPGSPSL